MKGNSFIMRSLLIGASLLFVSPAMAHNEESDVHSCIPKNDLRIPATELVNRGISEAEYNEVIEDTSSTYVEIFSERGLVLQVTSLWDFTEVNAAAEKTRYGVRRIHIYGGLARYPGMTKDALLAASCHEVGHHLGGAPTYSGDWASAEAQSDYFASKNCLKRIWRQPGKMSEFSFKNADPKIIADCEDVYSGRLDQAICVRSIVASNVLSKVLSELTLEQEPQYGSEDTNEVVKTIESYPSVQCRFDTFIAGAHCDIDIEDVPSPRSASQAACTRSKGDGMGSRPLCWFKPSFSLASN